MPSGLKRAFLPEELLFQEVFDSLTVQVAVLDPRGEILSVNRSWRASAEEGAPAAKDALCEGASYLGVCAAAAARGCAAAGDFAAGLRDVLAGGCSRFDFEYDCHTPGRERWFVAHVSAVGSGPAAAVVLHEEITERRLAEDRLRRSEELLRTFIADAPVALAMLDRDLRYLSVSHRWLADYGLGDASLAGRSHYEVFPEIGPEWREIHARGLAGEVIGREKDRFVRADGSVQWLRSQVRPWRAAGGGIGGLLIFSEDVTESTQALEALAESEAHFRALASTTSDWIWEVDAEARYTFASPRVLDLLGYAPEEVLGRTPFSFMIPAEAARVEPLYAEISACHQPFVALESVNRHKSGRPVVLESSGVPYFSSDGDFRGYRGVDRDVTARRQATRRAAAQAEVGRALAAAASLDEAARPVLEAIGRCEDWQVGAFWVIDPRRERLRCLACWHAGSSPGLAALTARARRRTLAKGEGFAGHVWAAAAPLLSPTLGVESDLAREGAALGLRAAIGFPILMGPEVLGVISFLGEEVHALEPGLLEAFEEIGRQIGQLAERVRAEETLKRFIAGSPAVIYALRVGAEALELVWHGGNLETMTGWRPSEVGGRWWTDNIHPEDRERVLATNALPYETDHQVTEYRFRRPDGRYLWLRDEKRLRRDEDGRPEEIAGSWTDVTERVDLEQRLRTSQKLEAIGRLAGGVAHDFNNVLTVIAGSGDLLARELPADGEPRRLLAEIREAGDRAASLTHQLLAFARNQVLTPRVLTLGSVVRGVEPMLRRLLGEDVLLSCVIDTPGAYVLVDSGQLEQVIVNLAVNARDAMPDGGRLTLAVDEVSLPLPEEEPTEAVPGRYARLTVTDTGTGMTAEVRERIFEPFFTTKPQGVGTGLGLATAFGIVTQSNGTIDVESAPGAGSRFRIHLPRVPAPEAVEARPRPSTPSASPGHETILLVEDEPAVRRIAQIALERQGYAVLAAAGGREAMALAAAHFGPIDLLMTDLVMPGMSGLELTRELEAARPGIAVLLMSGYSDDPLLRRGITDPDVAFLQKPFTLPLLAATVRTVLDGRPR